MKGDHSIINSYGIFVMCVFSFVFIHFKLSLNKQFSQLPRPYTKPMKAKKDTSYDQEVMEKAMEDIKKGDLTMRKAS